MDVYNWSEDLLTYGWLVSKVRPQQLSATFIIKATLRLRPDQAAATAGEPVPLSGEQYREGDPAKAMVYDSDFAPFKVRADILLFGTAHAPGGQPVRSLPVTLRVGSYSKTLAVHGPRTWSRGLLGSVNEAEPFTAMPLNYEHAFGGPGYARNPVGRGYKGQEAPNVEEPQRPLKTSWDNAEPASFGPLPAAWPQRHALVGTYDKEWLRERWPWFPADFDWGYFNAAPRDQQLEGYLRGDESVELHNLHLTHPVYRTRLPGLRARCVLEELTPYGVERCREVPLNLDTLWINPDEEKLVLVWRGVADVRSLRLREVRRVLVLAEPLTEPGRQPEQYLVQLDERLRAEDAAFEADFADMDNPAEDEAFEREMAEVEREAAELDAKCAELEAEAEATGPLLPPEAASLVPLEDAGLPDQAASRAAYSYAAIELLADHPELSGDMAELHDSRDSDREFARMEQEIDAADPFPDPPELDRESVAAIAARHESLAEQSLAGLDLGGLDLGGLDCTGADLAGTILTGTRLAGTNFTGADLSKADLSGADLTGAVLDDADLSEARLAGAKLTKLSLRDALVTKLELAGADLSGSHGEGADFAGSNLDGAKFLGARLPRADFSKAKLAGATFAGASLPHADFDRAQAPQANFEGADLTGLRASDANLRGGNFRKIQGPGSIWDGAVLDEAAFDRARLPQAQFADASLRKANFDRAVLCSASFQGACLVQAVLSNANLLRASFDQADLSRASLRASNLYGAGFWETVLEQASFEDANLKNTVLA